MDWGTHGIRDSFDIIDSSFALISGTQTWTGSNNFGSSFIINPAFLNLGGSGIIGPPYINFSNGGSGTAMQIYHDGSVNGSFLMRSLGGVWAISPTTSLPTVIGARRLFVGADYYTNSTQLVGSGGTDDESVIEGPVWIGTHTVSGIPKFAVKGNTSNSYSVIVGTSNNLSSTDYHFRISTTGVVAAHTYSADSALIGTYLTSGRCVETDSAGKLTSAAAACGTGSGGGGASTLEVLAGVSRTSPTVTVGFPSPQFTGTITGSSMTVKLDGSSVTLQGNTNVGLLNSTQTFTGAKTFQSTTTFTNPLTAPSFNATASSFTVTGAGGMNVVGNFISSANITMQNGGTLNMQNAFNNANITIQNNGLTGTGHLMVTAGSGGVDVSGPVTFQSSVTVTGSGGVAVVGTGDGEAILTIFGSTYTVASSSVIPTVGHYAKYTSTWGTLGDGGTSAGSGGGDSLGSHVATMTVTANYGVVGTTASFYNTTDAYTLRVATAVGGVNMVAVSSTVAKSPYDALVTIASPTVSAPTIHAWQLSGHHVSSGPAPSVAGCGTTPKVSQDSTDLVGRVTWSGQASACAITFATAWQVAPFCIATSTATGLGTSGWDVNSSTFSFSGLVGSTITYHCDGGKGG